MDTRMCLQRQLREVMTWPMQQTGLPCRDKRDNVMVAHVKYMKLMYFLLWEQVRCIPPLGERGYNSQPPDTKTVPGNGVLTYTCMDPTAFAGTTARFARFL